MKSKAGASPYIVWMVVFVAVPLAIVVYFAFTTRDGAFTLANITGLGAYTTVFARGIVQAVIATVICLIIAFPIGFMLSRMAPAHQKMMQMLIMLPMWMNFLLRTYAWMTLLENNGLINRFLGLFGIGPLHMINTSGAVVVAKNAHAATVLGGVGRGGIQVHKRYTALLTGILPYERGIIDAGIARIDEETINRMVDNAGQPARTGFEVLGYGYRHTLAEFSLYTGRTHQIRVHMWWLGYPLAGDDIYGWDFDLIGRHALHCGRIWFPHPVTGERIEVTAPPPEDFLEAIRRAGVRPKAESAHFIEKKVIL